MPDKPPTRVSPTIRSLATVWMPITRTAPISVVASMAVGLATGVPCALMAMGRSANAPTADRIERRWIMGTSELDLRNLDDDDLAFTPGWDGVAVRVVRVDIEVVVIRDRNRGRIENGDAFDLVGNPGELFQVHE